MPDKIMVSVLVRASWTPDLKDDVEYPDDRGLRGQSAAAVR